MMSLTFGLFTQVSGSGPLGPLVLSLAFHLAPILAVQTFGQVEGKRLTTLILHEVLITK